jgi:hypothetical protein
MVVQLELAQAEGEGAVLIPLPSPGEVETLDRRLSPFAELERYAVPVSRAAGGNVSGHVLLGPDPGPRGASAELRGTTVLPARYPAVRAWLARQRVNLDARAIGRAVDRAGADGSLLSTVVVGPTGSKATQVPPPIRVTFASDKTVVPRPIAPPGRRLERVVVHVLAGGPRVPAGDALAGVDPRANLPDARAVIAGRVQPDPNTGTFPPVRWPALHRPYVALGIGYDQAVHVSRFRGTWRGGATELVFEPMPVKAYWLERLAEADGPARRYQALAVLARHDSTYEGGRDSWRAEWLADRGGASASAQARLRAARSGSLADRIRLAGAREPLAPAVVKVLASDRSEAVRAVVAGRRDLPPKVWQRLIEDRSAEVRQAAADNRAIPMDQRREAILAWGTRGARVALAADPNTPAAVLETLAGDRSGAVRRAVARRTEKGELLSDLAGDPSASVRGAVAANPASGGKLLSELLSDPSPTVRAAAAGNPSLPQPAAEQLADRVAAGDRADERVASACALARSTRRPAVLARLAKARSWRVRQAVAANPAAPPGVLRTLLADARLEVVLAAADRQQLAPAAPAALARLARRELSDDHRRALAEHPACPGPVLAKLARDNNPAIRRTVAAHRSTPAPVLARLVADERADVRAAAAANASLPPEGLQRAAGQADLHAAVAANPTCPPEVLARLADSDRPAVRQAVASHPHCPDEALEALSRDPQRSVALTAWRRLKRSP